MTKSIVFFLTLSISYLTDNIFNRTTCPYRNKLYVKFIRTVILVALIPKRFQLSENKFSQVSVLRH